MKGIVLAGGSGTRLYPITEGISKQLIPIYDKPMIYYPLSILMLAGIRDILLITTKDDQPNFIRLFGDGSKFGLNISYVVQESPEGLSQAFTLGAKFIGNDSCAMILGDNIFFGSNLTELLKNAVNETQNGNATIFGYEVKDPQRFGIMELDKDNKVISVEEKPSNPKSDYAITGLYFYDNTVVDRARDVKKSARGEYEITDLNAMYLQDGKLRAELLGAGYAWFDTGLTDSLLDASATIKTLQNLRASIISCPEQIAYKQGWMTDEQLEERAELMKKNEYGRYLRKTLEKGRNK
ncbi:MAG: glucose-1-phosphate thymidylyltransferase RfbA [Bacilli bacterium]|nr:glucose-1-phosphate thymidylyltransferase RfbA [Bacilli bacterium]